MVSIYRCLTYCGLLPDISFTNRFIVFIYRCFGPDRGSIPCWSCFCEWEGHPENLPWTSKPRVCFVYLTLRVPVFIIFVFNCICYNFDRAVRLPIVLWGSFAMDVNEAVQTKGDESIICVLRFGKIKIWKGKSRNVYIFDKPELISKLFLIFHLVM